MNDRTPRIGWGLQAKLENINYHSITQAGTQPVSLHFSDIFTDNINYRSDWFNGLGIASIIAFALKATGQRHYLTLCKNAGLSIDVASEQELQMCIETGIPGHQIVANGPKSISFVKQALSHNCLLAVNSYNELLQVNNFLQSGVSKGPVSTILRIRTLGSRFGIPQEFLYKQTSRIENLHSDISFVGLSFHSDTIALQEKQQTIKELIRLQEYLTLRGHSISHLGIGGGYRVQYCANKLNRQSVREYHQGGGVYGMEFVDELLHTDIDGQPFYEFLLESFTTLIIEPGRALLDQAGLLIHNIIDASDSHITIDGNIYSTGAIAQEMPHDPLLYSQTEGLLFPDYSEQACLRQIHGNLCLESDIIYARPVPFRQQPKVGDQLIIVNTAGYFADFSHSEPISHTERKTIFM